MRATRLIEAAGVSVAHLHVTTLKPFSDPQVEEAIANAEFGVITMENHSAIGGLGTCVAELIAEKGLGKRLVKVSIGDRYLQGASLAWLTKHYGISASDLIVAVETLVNRKLGIIEARLETAEAGDFTGTNQLEAL